MAVEKPRRITRAFTQRLVAPPGHVFPLLCPVREADWLEGWAPVAVFSESGVAEPDCVFVTKGFPHDAVWLVSRHEPESGLVEMIKITPEVTACRLTIRLTPSATGCDALVTYAHTSLGPKGDEFLGKFTEEHYTDFMREWETRLNHYLRTGETLRTSGGGSGS